MRFTPKRPPAVTAYSGVSFRRFLTCREYPFCRYIASRVRYRAVGYSAEFDDAPDRTAHLSFIPGGHQRVRRPVVAGLAMAMGLDNAADSDVLDNLSINTLTACFRTVSDPSQLLLPAAGACQSRLPGTSLPTSRTSGKRSEPRV